MAQQTFGNIELTETLVRQKGANMLKLAALSRVDGVEVGFTHHPLLIGLAAIFILMGVANLSTEASAGGSVIFGAAGVFTLLAYLVTRRSRLAIRAGNLLMVQSVTGASFDKAVAFAEQVRTLQAEKSLAG